MCSARQATAQHPAFDRHRGRRRARPPTCEHPAHCSAFSRSNRRWTNRPTPTATDPIDLRLRNYAERDENEGKDFTSKELRACYQVGAKRFGWSRRTPEPRSMRDGRELVGFGMATGARESQLYKTSARDVLTGKRIRDLPITIDKLLR